MMTGVARAGLGQEVRAFTARAVIVALAVLVAFGPLALAFNYVTARGDDRALIGEIQAAFADGTLGAEDRLLNNREIGAFQFNDCAILVMAANSHGTVLERALSPFGRPPLAGDPAELSACGALSDIVVKGDEAGYGYSPYQRYLHGGRALAEAMVPLLGVQGTRELLLAANQLVLLSVLMLCLWRLREGARRTDLAAAVLSLLLLTMSGVAYFGQSLSMGPADLAVHVMFALMVAKGPLSMTRGAYLAIVAVAAAFVAYFEFLTGQIPLAVAMLLLLPALYLDRDGQTREAALRSVFGVATFLVVCAALFGIKFWISRLVFGPQVWADIGGELAMRMSLEGFSLLDVFMRLAYRTHHFVFGSVGLGLAYLGTALAAFGVSLSRDLGAARRGEGRWRGWRAAGFAASAGAVLAWYVIFSSHTAIHSWFMIRPLALCCAAAFAYLWLVTTRAADEPG